MRPAEEMAALAEAKAMRALKTAEAQNRLVRAVADVMSGDVTLHAACRNRGVSDDALRAALAERGWKPVRHRGTRSKARTT